MLYTTHSSVVGSNIALHTLLPEDRNNKTDKRSITYIRTGFWTCYFPSQLQRLNNSNSLEMKNFLLHMNYYFINSIVERELFKSIKFFINIFIYLITLIKNSESPHNFYMNLLAFNLVTS